MVETMAEENDFIDSCDYVLKVVNQDFEHVCTRDEVRKVIKELGFRYKKVKHIAMTANSERSLVLRQQWAVTLLKQKPQSKLLINLDESKLVPLFFILLFFQLGLVSATSEITSGKLQDPTTLSKLSR